MKKRLVHLNLSDNGQSPNLENPSNRIEPATNISNRESSSDRHAVGTKSESETLAFDNYNFRISYFATSSQGLAPVNVSAYGKTSIQPCNISDSTLFAPQMQCLANLFYLRGPGGDEEDTTIIVSAAIKEASSSLARWIMAHNPDLHLQSIPKGDIADALAAAYLKERDLHTQAWSPAYTSTRDELVTHGERKENSMMISEFGALVDGGGRLSYTTLLTGDGLKYIYSIELLLQFDDKAQKPTDRDYMNLYKQVVSSLTLVK